MTRAQIIAREKKLIKEWLDKGNKPKVFTRDFNNEDYQIGYIKGAPKNQDSASGSDK